MLRIVNLEEIEGLLRDVPALIDRIERNDVHAFEGVRRWLVEVEAALKNNRMPAVSLVASLRSQLVAADLGEVPSGVRIEGRITRRKVARAAMGVVTRGAVDIVMQAIAQDRSRVDEAERMCRQLVARDASDDAPGGSADSSESYTARLRRKWKEFGQQGELAAATIHIEGLVGPHDALLLLDRCVSANRR